MVQTKNRENLNLTVTINNVQINRVDSTKYLGLIVDKNLNWEDHILHIQGKIIPMIGAIYRCADYLNDQNCKLIYNSYILCHLRYLINIWGNTGVTSFRKIQVLQNRTVKILFKKDRLTPTEDLYRRTILKPIKYYLELEQSKQMYKIINMELKCNTIFSFNEEIHEYSTRNRNGLHLQTVRTNKALNSPISRLIRMYNSLPNNLKERRPYSRFLKKLKSLLGEKSYF